MGCVNIFANSASFFRREGSGGRWGGVYGGGGIWAVCLCSSLCVAVCFRTDYADYYGMCEIMNCVLSGDS